jgi:hypothetical protein
MPQILTFLEEICRNTYNPAFEMGIFLKEKIGNKKNVVSFHLLYMEVNTSKE